MIKVKTITTTTNTLLLSFRTVFSKWPYIAMAISIFGIFWVIFNVFDQLLFFSPIVTFYIPEDAIVDFILSSITAVLMGIVVSMNVFVLKYSKSLKKEGIASLLSGSTLSTISSTCASCSSLGFLIVSAFGGAGVTTSAFLSNYQTPIRIISIILLVWALYSINNKLNKSCTIQEDDIIKKTE